MANAHAVKPVNVDFEGAGPAETAAAQGSIVIIERRALIRDCLGRCLAEHLGYPVATFSDKASWERLARCTPASVILIGSLEESFGFKGHEKLSEFGAGAPVVVMSDTDDDDHAANSLRCGARGYIPSDTPLDIVVEAIRLVIVGGVFIPPNLIMPKTHSAVSHGSLQGAGRAVFTTRETAVIEALRQGKANKVIASDLQMSESTVKQHLHNVMRKLCVSNRTAAVVKIAELAAEGGQGYDQLAAPRTATETPPERIASNGAAPRLGSTGNRPRLTLETHNQ